MSPEITEQEIAQALDDPMFGSRVGDLTDAEINERVYARRYVNTQFGSPGSIPRERSVRRLMGELGSSFGSDAAEARTRLPPQRRKQLERASLAEKSRRTVLERELMGLPGGTPDVDPPLRRGISRLGSRAGRAVRGAGIATLKAIRNRLPAIIAMGGTGALFGGFPGAAAGAITGGVFDVMTTPSDLGSGEIPQKDRLTDEEKIKYYSDLFELREELDVGQYRPSILQPSREISGHSIRSSYPMR
jgi:hypothetical protein